MPKGFRPRPVKIKKTKPPAAPPTVGTFTAVHQEPGRSPVTMTIAAADWPDQRALFDILGPRWVRRCRELPGSVVPALRAVRWFLDFAAAHDITTWAHVTPDVLRTLESETIHRYTAARETLDQLWALLRDLPQGLLPQTTSTFLSHPPLATRREGLPTEGLPKDLLKAVLTRCKTVVATAEHRVHRAAPDSTDRFLRRDEVIAFYILLLFELSWSMDVLKYLTFNGTGDTTVTDWGTTNADDPKSIIGGQVVVKFFKKRGGASHIYTSRCDGPWRGGPLLRRLRNASQPLRDAIEPDSGLDPHSPWNAWYASGEFHPRRQDSQIVSQDTAHNGRLRRLFDGDAARFRDWLQRQNIAVPDEYDEAALSYRAIRPAAKGFRRVAASHASPGTQMGIDLIDDHTFEVYSRRYMRDAALMQELGVTYRDRIAGVAENVARTYTATVITSSGDVVVGQPVDDTTRDQLLSGDLETGLGGCRDPRQSPMPGQRQGDLCGVAFRACFFCPNALFGPQHVKRMKRMRGIAEEQRALMSPPEWQAKFGDTIDLIDVALPFLAPDADTVEQQPDTIIDLGTMAGPE